MKLLLDECIDRWLAKELTGHTVSAVLQMSWADIKNGALLSLAEQRSTFSLQLIEIYRSSRAYST